MRLMSVALTEPQVAARAKTVTRRLGWRKTRPGEQVQLVRKSMGRKRRDGTVEPLVRLAVVEIVSYVDGRPTDHLTVTAQPELL